VEGNGDIFYSKYKKVIEIYNPTTNQWTVHSMHDHFSAVNKLLYLSDGSIMVLGDYSTGIYNLKEDQFKELTSYGFYATDAVELPNGRVLITGADSEMNYGKAYIYTLETRVITEISLPSQEPLLYSLPNGQILALGTVQRVGEYNNDWKWDKMYLYTPPGIFLDVPTGYWAENEIKYLVDLNIIKGIGNENFGPSATVTRAQGAAMLSRALQLDLNDRPDPGFKDLSNDFWAYKEIAALVDEGIYPKETNFKPGTPLTREDMARLLVNAFKMEGKNNQEFTDIPKDYWAYSYINRLAANQITTGYPDGSFKPKNILTRTQFSVFLARALDNKFRK